MMGFLTFTHLLVLFINLTASTVSTTLHLVPEKKLLLHRKKVKTLTGNKKDNVDNLLYDGSDIGNMKLLEQGVIIPDDKMLTDPHTDILNEVLKQKADDRSIEKDIPLLTVDLSTENSSTSAGDTSTTTKTSKTSKDKELSNKKKEAEMKSARIARLEKLAQENLEEISRLKNESLKESEDVKLEIANKSEEATLTEEIGHEVQNSNSSRQESRQSANANETELVNLIISSTNYSQIKPSNGDSIVSMLPSNDKSGKDKDISSGLAKSEKEISFGNVEKEKESEGTEAKLENEKMIEAKNENFEKGNETFEKVKVKEKGKKVDKTEMETRIEGKIDGEGASSSGNASSSGGGSSTGASNSNGGINSSWESISSGGASIVGGARLSGGASSSGATSSSGEATPVAGAPAPHRVGHVGAASSLGDGPTPWGIGQSGVATSLEGGGMHSTGGEANSPWEGATGSLEGSISAGNIDNAEASRIDAAKNEEHTGERISSEAKHDSEATESNQSLEDKIIEGTMMEAEIMKSKHLKPNTKIKKKKVKILILDEEDQPTKKPEHHVYDADESLPVYSSHPHAVDSTKFEDPCALLDNTNVMETLPNFHPDCRPQQGPQLQAATYGNVRPMNIRHNFHVAPVDPYTGEPVSNFQHSHRPLYPEYLKEYLRHKIRHRHVTGSIENIEESLQPQIHYHFNFMKDNNAHNLGTEESLIKSSLSTDWSDRKRGSFVKTPDSNTPLIDKFISFIKSPASSKRNTLASTKDTKAHGKHFNAAYKRSKTLQKSEKRNFKKGHKHHAASK